MAKINQDNPLVDQLGIQKKQAEEAKKKDTLGQKEFLDLMIAQMQNQNPMEPMDNNQFLGQMAQFSTVTGLSEIKTSFENLSNSLVNNQALTASSLVGRFVMVPADTGYLPEGEGERFFGAVDLEQTVNNVNINVYTDNGQLVKTIAMGNQKEGLVRFGWDGTDQAGNTLPPGNYRIAAEGNIDGEVQAIETMVVAPVDSVTLGRGGGKMQLNVAGLGTMDFDVVREIL